MKANFLYYGQCSFCLFWTKGVGTGECNVILKEQENSHIWSVFCFFSCLTLPKTKALENWISLSLA